MKKLSKTTRTNALTYAGVTLAFVVMQILISTGNISSSLNGQLIPICAWIIMAISLNLTVGILGELSLGHAGFMSVGAFTGAIAAIGLQSYIPSPIIRLILAILTGAVCAGIVGILIGIPVLRLKGDYLAIVTLAFGEIIRNIVNCLYVGVDSSGLHFSIISNKLNLAEGGRMIIDGAAGISGNTKISTFISGFVLIIITLIVVLNMINSRTGRAIMAIRDNRIAAESTGIPITRYKMTAFATSAALAGAAGALYAMNMTTVVATKFDFNTSIFVLVYVVLGGLGNIWGSIISATLLYILPELLRGVKDYRMLVYAIVLILVMLATNSTSFKNLFSKIRAHITGGKNSAAVEEASDNG